MPVREIIYHFNVEASSLPLQNFIDAATASQAILSDLNKHVYDGRLRYELRVVPPERGSFIAILTLVIVFINTDYGKEIVKNITGKEPAEHVRHFFERFDRRSVALQNNEQVSDQFISDEIQKVTRNQRSENTEQSEFAVDCLSNAHNAILVLDAEELKSGGITIEKFETSFRARDEFYKGCLKNTEIMGLGFERANCSTLGRENFEKLIISDPSYESSRNSSSPKEWTVEIADISVYSPNWKKKGRKWLSSTDKHGDISFTIDDETFWHKVQRGEIVTTTNDVLRVQWGYPRGRSKPSGDVRVVRVLRYNGYELSESLTEAEVTRILGGEVGNKEKEPTLF